MALGGHQPIAPQVRPSSQLKNRRLVGCAKLEEDHLVSRDESARDECGIVVAQLRESTADGIDIHGRHAGPIALHEKSGHM